VKTRHKSQQGQSEEAKRSEAAFGFADLLLSFSACVVVRMLQRDSRTMMQKLSDDFSSSSIYRLASTKRRPFECVTPVERQKHHSDDIDCENVATVQFHNTKLCFIWL
jgi:hypothetical protein